MERVMGFEIEGSVERRRVGVARCARPMRAIWFSSEGVLVRS